MSNANANATTNPFFPANILYTFPRADSIDTTAVSTPYDNLADAQTDVARALASYDLKTVYSRLDMSNELEPTGLQHGATAHTLPHGFGSPAVAHMDNTNVLSSLSSLTPTETTQTAPPTFHPSTLTNRNRVDSFVGQPLATPGLGQNDFDPFMRPPPAAVCYCGNMSLDNLVRCSQTNCRYGVMHAQCTGFGNNLPDPVICVDCVLRTLHGTGITPTFNAPTMAQRTTFNPTSDFNPASDTHHLAAFGALNTFDTTNIPSTRSPVIPGLGSFQNTQIDAAPFPPYPSFPPVQSIPREYDIEDIALYGPANAAALVQYPSETTRETSAANAELKSSAQATSVIEDATSNKSLSSMVVDSVSESSETKPIGGSDDESSDSDEEEDDDDDDQFPTTDCGSPTLRQINHKLIASRKRVAVATPWPSFAGSGDKFIPDVLPRTSPSEYEYGVMRAVIQPGQQETTRTKKGDKIVKRTSTRALAWRTKVDTECPACLHRIKKRIVVRMVPRSTQSHAFVAKHGRYACSNCKKCHHSVKAMAAHVRNHDDPRAVVLDEGTETLQIRIDQALNGEEYEADVDEDMDCDEDEEDDDADEDDE